MWGYDIESTCLGKLLRVELCLFSEKGLKYEIVYCERKKILFSIDCLRWDSGF